MNDHTMTTPTMKLAVASKDNANYVAGRRAFFKYRDLGVTEGTNGFMRAQVTSAPSSATETRTTRGAHRATGTQSSARRKEGPKAFRRRSVSPEVNRS